MKLDRVQCQGCHGRGGTVDVVLPDGTGPWEACGYCMGTGETTRLMNGWIMRWARYPLWAPKPQDEALHLGAMWMLLGDRRLYGEKILRETPEDVKSG